MEKFHKFENVARSMYAVDYTKVFAVDVLEKSTRELCENATNSRKSMTTALESGDPKSITKATNEYFGLGWSVLRSIEDINSSYRVPMKSSLKYGWTSSVAENSKRTYEGSVLIYDLIQTLVSRGVAYNNFAVSLLSSEKYKPAGTALRVAAGIFDVAAKTLIPKWKNLRTAAFPPECDANLCLALKEFAMAQAQQATILMAVASGKTKMVPVLLLGLGDRFERVSRLVSGMSSVETAFKSHVSDMRHLMRATAHEKIANACWDAASYGKAIKILTMAKKMLSSCDDRDSTWVEMNKRIENTLTTWNKENETIFFDVPPDRVDLPKSVELLQPLPFSLPEPSILSFKQIEVVEKKKDEVPAPPAPVVMSKVEEEEEEKKEEEEKEEEKKEEETKPTSTTKPQNNLYSQDFTDADFGSSSYPKIPTTTTTTKKEPLRWQFEDGRAGSEKWKDYNADDAKQLDKAMQSGKRNVTIRNRFGTYNITLPSRPSEMGSQINRRSGGTRRVRCVVPGQQQQRHRQHRRQDEDRTRVSVVPAPSGRDVRSVRV